MHVPGPRSAPALAPALALALAPALLTGCGGPATAPTRPPATSSTPATTASTPTGPVSTTAPGAPDTWTTAGATADRTAAVPAPAFTHPPTEAWTSAPLDGPVYGEPLVFGGQVLVGTENDTVYGLDAASGATVWSVHLGTPVPAGSLPCGDIAPTVGITSTMVLDPARSLVFSSAEEASPTGVRHVLAAISTTGHALSWTVDLDQPGWSAPAQLQRTALALDAGHVLVGFGGNYGDCGSYHGWVVGVPESGAGPVLTYRVPTANGGAVWAPSGIAVDPAGTAYVATGNASAGPGQPFDYGEAVIALGPDLTVRGFFAPADWAQDSAADLDLGSTAPMNLGDGRLFIVGKQATAYLLRAAAPGGIGHPLASVGVCNSRGGNAYDPPDAFVVCSDDGTLAEVAVGPGNRLARGWTWRSPTGHAGSPLAAGGVVWSVDPGASTLYGVDRARGTTRYTVPLATGAPNSFTAPVYAGGMLVVAGSRAVEALH